MKILEFLGYIVAVMGMVFLAGWLSTLIPMGQEENCILILVSVTIVLFFGAMYIKIGREK